MVMTQVLGSKVEQAVLYFLIIFFYSVNLQGFWTAAKAFVWDWVWLRVQTCSDTDLIEINMGKVEEEGNIKGS